MSDLVIDVGSAPNQTVGMGCVTSNNQHVGLSELEQGRGGPVDRIGRLH